METNRNTILLLDQIPQPGLWVREDQIQYVNPAARAMLLAPGQRFSPLLHTGAGEYAAFQQGHLCLTLSIAGMIHNAVVTQAEAGQLVLLEPCAAQEEFRMLALAAMQLRLPLAQAVSSSRQLDLPGPAAETMNRSLMQLMRIVNNMSDISLYASTTQLELKDADSFLRELFDKARSLTAQKARLSFTGPGQPVFTLLDTEQLERAVWNLLSNCLKFLPEGGSISASLKRQGQLLHLTISDTGSGIAQNVRATVFQRYLRQPGLEDIRYGLGLGLSIVRTAAANHGGTVLIRSDADGGTHVTMTIAIRRDSGTVLHSPLLRPDYAGGFDHSLMELSDCLRAEQYSDI